MCVKGMSHIVECVRCERCVMFVRWRACMCANVRDQCVVADVVNVYVLCLMCVLDVTHCV